MWDLFSTLQDYAIQLWVEFANFFRMLVIDNVSIGDLISNYLPDGLSLIGNVLSWILPFTAFEFLFLSLGLWLSFVVAKFIVGLFR